MEPTGPTGNFESVGLFVPTGSTGPIAMNVIQEPPHLVTMEELMTSHAVVLAGETNDRLRLAPLVSPTRDEYRPQLFQ